MRIRNFPEIFFILACGLAMPFIVIGSYFNFIKRTERNKWWAIFFLVISILYALSYAYFSYKTITNSKKWKELTAENKENKEK